MRVTKEVWEFLDYTLKKINVPVMIERDNNIPSYKAMTTEYKTMQKVVQSV
jgi:uncharacterized protein (UPF0276 family)